MLLRYSLYYCLVMITALSWSQAKATVVFNQTIEHVESVDVRYVDGVIHLLLGKHIAGRDSVWYQASHDDGQTWSTAVNVSASYDGQIKMARGNDVRIAVQGDNLIAVWMQKIPTAKRQAGPMYMVRSSDKGKTWQTVASPADWQGPHGFFALDADEKRIGLVWLDSRRKVGTGATQGLRYTFSEDGGGTWSTNQTLDERSCACCWNSAQYHQGELYVIYRDKDPSDMTLGKVDQQQQWHRLNTVGDFQWQFQGCPHIGGSIALTEQQIHATVGTGHAEHIGSYYLRSHDLGRHWEAPIRLGNSHAVHSDIASYDKKVTAGWDTLSAEGLEVMVATSTDAGQQWDKAKLLSERGKEASHPRVVVTDKRHIVLWTQGLAKQPKTLVIKGIQ